MASTCNYKLGKLKFVKGSICFAAIRNFKGTVKIIVYFQKSPFTPTQIRKYLVLLKNVGFNFTFKTIKDSPEYKDLCIEIDLKEDTSVMRTLFCMYVRCLWEGYVKNQPSTRTPNYDEFIKVVEFLFKLKEAFPNKRNYILLNIACNLFIIQQNPYNSNHFPARQLGCYLFDTLPRQQLTDLGNVNDVMTIIDTVKISTKAKQVIAEDFKNPKTNKEFYTEMLHLYKKHN